MEESKKKSIVYSLLFMIGLLSCSTNVSENKNDEKSTASNILVDRIDTCCLMLLFPSYSKVDLVCGTMPSMNDNSVLMCAEACFTKRCLIEFDHYNVAGDHVSNGVRYHGYKCERNTGAFVYYDSSWKFLYKDYSSEMNIAASKGGSAFAQEMIIHKGEKVETIRKGSDRNQFRALCEINNKLCIAESRFVMTFGQFKQSLIDINATEALYLDMGNGWNYAWYRTNADSITILHSKSHDYCTNWITFYK